MVLPDIAPPSARWFLIEDLNPQPWALGPLGVGRRNGGTYAYVGPNQQLVNFQQAVKAELGHLEPFAWEGDVALKFFLWRQIEKIEGFTGTGKKTKARSHGADSTNLQKGLEDALQGVLISNDKLVRSVSTELVEQGLDVKPRILVRIEPWLGFDPNQIPDGIWNRIDNQPALFDEPNSWQSADSVF